MPCATQPSGCGGTIIYERKSKMFLTRFRKKAAMPEESNRINGWKDMYEGKHPSGVTTLNLPAAISSELARLVTIEMKAEASGSEAAKAALEKLVPKLRSDTELACALGGGMFRPYFKNGGISVEFIPADRFVITSFDDEGAPDGCIFTDRFKDGDRYYTRLEEHKIIPEGYEVTNRAYVSKTVSADFGTPVNLSSVERWKNLSERVVIQKIHRPLFVYFKMPFADNKSMTSKLGVSVFDRASGLIAEADKQFSRLLWEFEGGELAIDASVDALRFNERGVAEAPKLSKRLFRGLGIDAGDHDLYSVFSPELRDESIINGLNEILMRIEDTCGLARGTFSNAVCEAKTATEIKILNQRSYSTVCDIQNALKFALERVAEVCAEIAALYGIEPLGKPQLSVEFDDSIVTDRGAEFEEKLKLVQAEIMTADEMREWYFGKKRRKIENR